MFRLGESATPFGRSAGPRYCQDGAMLGPSWPMLGGGGSACVWDILQPEALFYNQKVYFTTGYVFQKVHFATGEAFP